MIRILQTNVHNKLLTSVDGFMPRVFFAIQNSSNNFASYINGGMQELFSIHPNLCIGHICHLASKRGSRNQYIYNLIGLGILSLLLILVGPVHAQESEKAHYVLKTERGDANLVDIQTALSKRGSLDGFRFLNARREIVISGTGVVVELFSAKELLDLYGKAVSPLTISDESGVANIEFVLTENGLLKERLRP